MATRLYGCIVEYGLQTGEMQAKIYSHNKSVIDKLPENDQWPPLSKKMFAITENSGEYTPDYSYSGRIIHFGANFKSIEYEWMEWKIKFEDLLSRLLWLEADVHFKTEYADIQTFKWRVDLKKWTLYDKVELEPIKKEYWDFKGEIN